MALTIGKKNILDQPMLKNCFKKKTTHKQTKPVPTKHILVCILLN